MNLEPKILLTVELPSTLSQNKEMILLNFEKSTENNKDIIIERGKVNHYQRVATVAQKKLTISQYAYDFFISKEIPSDYNKNHNKGKNWPTLSIHERLNFHLNALAENKPFSYEILE